MKRVVGALVRSDFLRVVKDAPDKEIFTLGQNGSLLRSKIAALLTPKVNFCDFNGEQGTFTESEGLYKRPLFTFQGDKLTTNELEPLKTITAIPSVANDRKWTFGYQNYLRQKRKWWKKHFFDPGSVETTERDAASDAPSCTIECSFKGQNLGLSHNLTLEGVQVLDRDQVPEYFGQKNEWKLVSTETCFDSGTLAILLDSVRNRIFLPKDYVCNPRLALNKFITPYQVAISIAEPMEIDVSILKDLDEFKTYLTLLLEEEGIKVWSIPDNQDFFNEYEAADGHGIPYMIILTPQTLDDGVVNIRDRETTWFEQIHASYLVQRFVRCFQDRYVEDTWTQLSKKKST